MQHHNISRYFIWDTRKPSYWMIYSDPNKPFRVVSIPQDGDVSPVAAFATLTEAKQRAEALNKRWKETV